MEKGEIHLIIDKEACRARGEEIAQKLRSLKGEGETGLGPPTSNPRIIEQQLTTLFYASQKLAESETKASDIIAREKEHQEGDTPGKLGHFFITKKDTGRNSWKYYAAYRPWGPRTPLELASIIQNSNHLSHPDQNLLGVCQTLIETGRQDEQFTLDELKNLHL